MCCLIEEVKERGGSIRNLNEGTESLVDMEGEDNKCKNP